MPAVTITTETDAPTLGGVRELFCDACGYGITIRKEPPECPMCRSSSWSERTTSRWN